MIFINRMSSASAKSGSGGGDCCSRRLSVRGRSVGLISVNSVRGKCKNDVILLPWCRFLLRAGTFLVDIVLIMVVGCSSMSITSVVIVGSVWCSNCL